MIEHPHSSSYVYLFLLFGGKWCDGLLDDGPLPHPDKGLPDHPLSINEIGDGNRTHLAVACGDFGVGQENGVRDCVRSDPGLDFVNAFVIECDPNELNALVGHGLLDFDEIGKFLTARRAPCSPEVKHYDFSAIVGEMMDFAVEVFEFEVGGKSRGLCGGVQRGRLGHASDHAWRRSSCGVDEIVRSRHPVDSERPGEYNRKCGKKES